MRKGIAGIVLGTLCAVMMVGCDGDNGPSLSLLINGLADLGATAKYEGWLIVDGVPVSTGVFDVDASGSVSSSKFGVSAEAYDRATAFVLTIEPFPDTDPAPSDTHILAGSFSDMMADVSVGHPAALGNDLSGVAGSYILATPTDGPATSENSGIWFLDLSSGSPAQGLTLPTLPAGWLYEGWAVINGTPVSTGTFTSPTGADDAAPHSGTAPGPPFPGEDFLVNAPAGLTFPTDIAGGKAVISIEPSPDNSAAPFLLKPLVGDIPAGATDHVNYAMGANLGSLPSGTVRLFMD
ncbi:MAG: anti-sigma factor [Lentisphaerae bacterium]|nr:anti-sigma factor [Lentisphaerota bacterium]